MKYILSATATLFLIICLLSCGDGNNNTGKTNGTVLADANVSSFCPEMMVRFSVIWRSYTNNTNLSKEVTVILDEMPGDCSIQADVQLDSQPPQSFTLRSNSSSTYGVAPEQTLSVSYYCVGKARVDTVTRSCSGRLQMILH